MRDHAHYEELAVLAAGGHLSPEEANELRIHLVTCATCRQDVQAYGDLVSSGLPLLRDQVMADDVAGQAPEAGARERFLVRARSEGLQFSKQVDVADRPLQRSFLSRRAITGLMLAASVIIGLFYGLRVGGWLPSMTVAQGELDRLRQENAQLAERLTTRDREIGGQQQQLRALRAQLDAAGRTVDGLRRGNAEQGAQLGRSTSQTADLVGELQNRDRQLAAITDEISRINQLRATDRAILGTQEARLKSLRDQLRIATATLDMERQMADTGRDLVELLRTKQLRVIDVRDTDASGRPGPSFARVFVADGRSIRIFAFDLDGANAGARRFQVWAESSGDTNAVRSLGTLDLDDRTQNRWSLTVQNEAIKDIDSVFVTASSRANVPDGPRLLYASIGR